MSISIRDVAERAGVSISTVSRVLNETCPVAADKVRRVRRAAIDLGYTPNPAARSLLSKTTGGLGVLLPYVAGEFFSEFLSGIDLRARELGYFLLISTSHHSVTEFRAAVRGLHRRVDGLVVMAPQLTPTELGIGGDIRSVFVNSSIQPGIEHADVINFDNASGTFESVRHLSELGHERIAYVRGPFEAHDAGERVEGYLAGIRQFAGSGDNALVINADYTRKAGFAAATHIVAMRPRPTAVMAANDYCAIGVISGLREAGLRVPEDVSVIGFDDVASSQYSQPPLTTVHVPIRDIGVAAINKLIARIRETDTSEPRIENLAVRLVPRGSCGPRSG